MSELLKSLMPGIGMVCGVGLALGVGHLVLIRRHPEMGNERMFARQLVMLGLSLLGVLAVVLVLPVDDDSRNRLLGLFGILLSGIIAFSSTTIFANLAAGLLLRVTKPFKTGDFIRVGEHFGRVSERGLFDTEIQTETRELVALPNTFCIANPVATIRSSGTLISATLSLGYEVHHARVESLLLEAAKEAELEDPFVHILELGDFSVRYRVSGLLSDPKFLISARSRLYGRVLDTLHASGVEIMSPSYMNQRRLGEGHRAMPERVSERSGEASAASVEDIAFDKAERAEHLESGMKKLQEEIEETRKAQKEADGGEEGKRLGEKLERLQLRVKAIEKATTVLNQEDQSAGK